MQFQKNFRIHYCQKETPSFGGRRAGDAISRGVSNMITKDIRPFCQVVFSHKVKFSQKGVKP